jgi:hypothetical protein
MMNEDVEDFGLGERDDLDNDLRYIYCAHISIGHTRLFSLRRDADHAYSQ